ncbi:hypothetical protein HK104_003029, partial [Borealophlyctis nickersoniae]
MSPRKPLKVAVIGAGVSGLVTAKELLTAQLDVTVFDRGTRVGGIWAYDEDTPTSSVMRQTVLNLSKTKMSFSDFPIPDDLPDYLPHHEYEKYLISYAEHFDVTRHVRLNTSVRTINPLDGGRWEVVTSTGNAEKDKHETFDRVVITTGQNQIPFIPDTAGVDEFKGTVVHSSSYRSFEPYFGKRVLVIGAGNSGGDVAVDLSGNAEKVFLSSRRGIWLLPRFLLFGRLLDTSITRKSMVGALWKKDILMRMISRIMVGDLSKFGLNPAFKPSAKSPVINDHLGERLRTGKVLARPDVARLLAREVEFVDGHREKIDAVIYCTGFQRRFPFLPSLEMSGQSQPSAPFLALYKRMIPISHPTLAFVGQIRAPLSLSIIVEMQARWIARLFADDIALPATDTMQAEVDKYAAWLRASVPGGQIKAPNVPALKYMDELAADIGCAVDFGALWWDRPVLRKLVIKGPFSGFQYRLFGSG